MKVMETAWGKETIDFIHNTLSSDKVFVAVIKCNEPYYVAHIVCDEMSYEPPLFWRVSDIFVTNKLHLKMEINTADLFKLMI